MTTKSHDAFVNKVKKYLSTNNIPFIPIDGTKNILVLKSSKEYHYLLIQFFDMPDDWTHRTRHFNIKNAYGIDSDQTINAIKRYFN
jgi:hypothetical protein